MRLPPLIPGKLLRRYKRFFADVELASGELVTAAVCNTGSMRGLLQPGMAVFLTENNDFRRKLRYSWLLAQPGRSLVCVDTSLPNRLIHAALLGGEIAALAGYREVVCEMPLGDSSRADFLLRVHETEMLARCWVEVKAVTLAEGTTSLFPDSVTTRGRRHLEELARRARLGDRAVQLFLVQRSDCRRFRPADDIDPAYGRALREAVAAGVEILVLRAQVTKHRIAVGRQLPVEL
jgi:sugar fermentation stimulation protein A